MTRTRKYFGTDGVRGKIGDSVINPEFVLKLGWALGCVLSQQGRGKVLIGKDTRISGYMLESALEAGLSAAGIDSHLLGPMPTPAVAYLTRTLRARAGIVISASHNPYHDNGIKFFSDQGCKLDDAFELELEAKLEQPMQTVSSHDLGRARRVVDAPGRYIEFCKSTVPPTTSLSGLKIVLDCANGATYHIAPNVFSELGAEVIDIATDPNGFNINEGCGATEPELLQKTVLEQKADLGIALDGDGDRVIMVDHTGAVVDGDEIIFIMAKDLLERQQLKGGVVGTVMSNMGLEVALKKLNVDFTRAAVGDRYVIEELFKRQWVLGSEPSGHVINLGANTTGDGIIAALQVLMAMRHSDQSLHNLKRGMTKFPQAKINIKMPNAKAVVATASIKSAVADIDAKLKNKGRVILRPSGTEPLMRIMVEGEDAREIDGYAQQLAQACQAV